MNVLRKILTVIRKAEIIAAKIGVASFTLTIFAGAVTRQFGHPLNWTATVALFIFAWTTFICGDIAFQNGRLVNINILISHFPVKVQKIIATVIYGIIIVFLIYLIYLGIKICPTTVHRAFNGTQGFSYLWVALSVPVCFSLILITAVERYIGIMKSDDPRKISDM